MRDNDVAVTVHTTAGRGRAVLTFVMLIAVTCLGLLYPPPDTESHEAGRTDFALFAAVLDRLKAGEHYYPAMGAELSARGYPTSRVFNWRPPFYLSLLALGPIELWRGVLVALLLALVVITVACLRPKASVAGLLGTAAQVGVLVIFAAPNLVLLGDTWAGVFLGLSTALQVLGWGSSAAAVAIIALFFRELAAPFCVAGVLIAAWHRRQRELMVWAVGALAFGSFYLWHAREVWAQAVPEHTARASEWLQFGGMPFLLSAVRWTGLAFVLPNAGVVAVLVLVCAGVANPRAPLVVRVASAVYAAFFLVAGQTFNHYWGLVAAPVWVFACAYGATLLLHPIRTLVNPTAFRGGNS